jgi:gluconolactonase
MNPQPCITTLATGLDFPEGPTFDSAGKLWFTEVKAGCLTCYDAGKLERIVAGGHVGGMVFDAAGDIWFTDAENHKLRKYLRREQRFEDVLSSVEGKCLNRPNDLAFDAVGNLIFSCHADGRTEPLGYLVALSKDGSAKVISRNKFFTNGIAFSEDGRWLYFSETYKWRVWRAAWDAVNATILEEQPWVETGGPIGPDGLALDSEGNLYMAVFDQSRIAVVSPTSKLIETISLPVKRPTSCAFDPSGRLGLVVTDADKGCLLSVDMKRQGAKLFYR